MFDNIFRVFMFSLPYALCLAAYIWVGKKALAVPNKVARIIATAIVAGGLGYTLYKLVRSAGTVFTNDNFEYIIIIVTVGVLFFASIAMALGEPEEEKRKNDTPSFAQTADDKKGTVNEEGKENGLNQ